jgi:hypothetical protein
MIGLHGKHINLFIEPGPFLGPVLEVTVDNIEETKLRLVKSGCEIINDEPGFPRCYVKDPVPTENSISVKKVKQSSCGKRIPRLPGRRWLLLPPKRQYVSFSA